jgi:hypothetical protein
MVGKEVIYLKRNYSYILVFFDVIQLQQINNEEEEERVLLYTETLDIITRCSSSGRMAREESNFPHQP